MIFGKISGIVGVALSLFFLGSGILAAAPVTFNTALPVAKDEILVRLQIKMIRSAYDSSGADRDLRIWLFPVVVAYGVTEKLALFGMAPVLDKKMELNGAGGRVSRGARGVGDITALARFTAWKKDMPGETTRLAPFFALEMPTAADDEADSLGRLPQPLQLGSGSWDPSVGLVLTHQSLRRQMDASISYKFNTAENGFEFGDVAKLDLSYQHRIWPATLSSGVPAFLYGVFESNLIWQDKDRIDGVNDNNSGGVTWYLAPGIQYVTRRTVAEFVFQLPVSQNLHGSALENDFIATLSFRMNF